MFCYVKAASKVERLQSSCLKGESVHFTCTLHLTASVLPKTLVVEWRKTLGPAMWYSLTGTKIAWQKICLLFWVNKESSEQGSKMISSKLRKHSCGEGWTGNQCTEFFACYSKNKYMIHAEGNTWCHQPEGRGVVGKIPYVRFLSPLPRMVCSW